jgi:hypothetical protein
LQEHRTLALPAKNTLNKRFLFWRNTCRSGYYLPINFVNRSCYQKFILGVLLVWLAVELFAALYVVLFAWFWHLCRSSARREVTPVRERESPSNLIPFERGLEMRLRKTSTAV